MVGGFRQKLSNRLVRKRMPEISRNFRERQKNKPPLRHARMGNFKSRRMNDARAEKENVQVNRARSAKNLAPPTHGSLNRLQCVQELAGH